MKITKMNMQKAEDGYVDVDEFSVVDEIGFKATMIDRKEAGLAIDVGDKTIRLDLDSVVELKSTIDSFLSVFSEKGKMIDKLISTLLSKDMPDGMGMNAKVIGAASNEEMEEKIAQLQKDNPEGKVVSIDMKKVMESGNPAKAIKEMLRKKMGGACTCPECTAKREAEGTNMAEAVGAKGFVTEIDKDWRVKVTPAKGKKDH